ncbi:leukotriene C4 synthase isoform X1 [Anas platyrhynchos]|uniref:Leukotriene C4 synthase n=1 Tax=Anas platyrhynchos platyrhynchos TaxID=8840 RepID=A0A493T7W1_ANAPP|nr:leukotriene C4 synthase isoform X1 [Anas platyrhynchos]
MRSLSASQLKDLSCSIRASLCCRLPPPTTTSARTEPGQRSSCSGNQVFQPGRINMLDQIHLLAAVTVLGVLEQAYFLLQVIYARRRFGISPPNISGPPEFERIFRAQVNSSEYFPIFVALLWQAGLFFHQGLAAALGLLYLYSRYCYFVGYRASSSERLAPIYFSTGVLWILVAASALGLLHFFLSHYTGLNVLRLLAA